MKYEIGMIIGALALIAGVVKNSFDIISGNVDVYRIINCCGGSFAAGMLIAVILAKLIIDKKGMEK